MSERASEQAYLSALSKSSSKLCTPAYPLTYALKLAQLQSDAEGDALVSLMRGLQVSSSVCWSTESCLIVS